LCHIHTLSESNGIHDVKLPHIFNKWIAKYTSSHRILLFIPNKCYDYRFERLYANVIVHTTSRLRSIWCF